MIDFDGDKMSTKRESRVRVVQHKSECEPLDEEMRRRAESFRRQFPDAWPGFEEAVKKQIEERINDQR